MPRAAALCSNDFTGTIDMKTPFSRRRFLKTSTLAAGAGLSFPDLLKLGAANAATNAEKTNTTTAATGDVSIRLLDGKALTVDSGVSFGVPWPQGSIKGNATFSLTTEGEHLPLQSWPLAYWPDGSLKWSGFATVVPAGLATPLTLSPRFFQASGTLKVTEDGKSVVVDTGKLKCSIPLAEGARLFDSMIVEGRAIAGEAQLVCILQNGPQTDPEDSPARERFVSLVKKVTVEQSGPVRAVVKFEGVHKGAKSAR